jgi:hypothetical protein
LEHLLRAIMEITRASERREDPFSISFFSRRPR